MATNLSALKLNPLKSILNPIGSIMEQKNTPVPYSPVSTQDPIQSAMAHSKDLQSQIDQNVAKQSQPTGMPSIDFSSAINGNTATNKFMQ